MEKIALFVDWENLKQEIHYITSKNKEIRFNYHDPISVTTLFHSFVNKKESLYRIFFYTALPLSVKKVKEIYAQKLMKTDNLNIENVYS